MVCIGFNEVYRVMLNAVIVILFYQHIGQFVSNYDITLHVCLFKAKYFEQKKQHLSNYTFIYTVSGCEKDNKK